MSALVAAPIAIAAVSLLIVLHECGHYVVPGLDRGLLVALAYRTVTRRRTNPTA